MTLGILSKCNKLGVRLGYQNFLKAVIHLGKTV